MYNCIPDNWQFLFRYGVISFKHRFSINRSLDDYSVTYVPNVLSVTLQLKYKTMARDNLVYELYILYRKGFELSHIVLDLKEYTFTVLYHGDSKICL